MKARLQRHPVTNVVLIIVAVVIVIVDTPLGLLAQKEHTVAFETARKSKGTVTIIDNRTGKTVFKQVQEDTVYGKHWIKGDKRRSELKGRQEEWIDLLVPSWTYRLYPKTKTGAKTQSLPSPELPADVSSISLVDPTRMLNALRVMRTVKKVEKVGAESVGGQPCDVWEFVSVKKLKIANKEEERKIFIKVWARRTDSVVLKEESRFDGSLSTTEYNNIRIGVSVPDSLFEVPNDYKVSSM